MSDEAAIGALFPLSGPVPPELVIGREGDIEELTRRMRERLHTMLTGPRRIGKSTVCGAACDALRKEMVVIEIDVPERPDSRALLQAIINACSRISIEHRARRLIRAATPLVEDLLKDASVPLDLRELGARPADLPVRDVIALPARVAEREKRHVLLFLDEIQRVVDYADGQVVIADIVDIYGKAPDAIVLADGSDERAADKLFAPPNQFGKLVDQLPLAPAIPAASWRGPLTQRFAQAGLVLDAPELADLLEWGEGHPYRTMAVARYTALTARKTRSERVDGFDLQMGKDEAERHLRDDGFA